LIFLFSNLYFHSGLMTGFKLNCCIKVPNNLQKTAF
jgi:hypothetical protein